MKNAFFYTLLVTLFIVSCSDDGDSSDSAAIFMPLETNSAWVYDVNIDNQLAGRDSLYVSGETIISGKTYKTLVTQNPPTGFYTNALNNSAIRKDGDKLVVSGATGLGLADFLPVEIALSDFVIFKENSSNNSQIDIAEGTIEQDFQGFPLKIDYKLISQFKETLPSFTVPGKETYSNVKVMTIIANLKVTTTYLVPIVNSPITVGILDPQNVIVSTHYYVENVGMVYAKTDVNFEVNDFSQFGIELPIPQQGSAVIEEFLD